MEPPKSSKTKKYALFAATGVFVTALILTAVLTGLKMQLDSTKHILEVTVINLTFYKSDKHPLVSN